MIGSGCVPQPTTELKYEASRLLHVQWTEHLQLTLDSKSVAYVRLISKFTPAQWLNRKQLAEVSSYKTQAVSAVQQDHTCPNIFCSITIIIIVIITKLYGIAQRKSLIVSNYFLFQDQRLDELTFTTNCLGTVFRQSASEMFFASSISGAGHLFSPKMNAKLFVQYKFWRPLSDFP